MSAFEKSDVGVKRALEIFAGVPQPVGKHITIQTRATTRIVELTDEDFRLVVYSVYTQMDHALSMGRGYEDRAKRYTELHEKLKASMGEDTE